MHIVGQRQATILGLLAAGPHSLSALIARLGADQEAMILGSLKRLELRGVIEVTGRQRDRSRTGVMVALKG